MVLTSRKLNILALLSAIPVSLSIQMIDTPFTWLMYTLAFFTFIESKPREAFFRGSLVGISAAVINFFWITASAGRFTGTSLLYGIGAIAGLSLFFALYCGSIGWVYSRLKWRRRHSKALWVNSLLIASLWVMLDAFMIYIAKSFALALFVTYTAVGDNTYALQPAAVTGPLVITFLIVFTNALLAMVLFYRRWKLLPLPFLLTGAYLFWGFLLLDRYQQEIAGRHHNLYHAAIIAENLNPEYKWNNVNGNKLAQGMFLLNAQVAKSGADIAIWSESAIPWNYSPDDEFLKEIDKITQRSNITHLIGMNTDYQGNTFYNSVYCMNPGMKFTGRYDKRVALSLIEKPFSGLLLPFFNSTGFRVKEGTDNKPLLTPCGPAGILLCNESSVPGPAYASVKSGAEFLVNPGNDGWFTDTYIPKQHFFHARLRAVETRKDILINNNLGYFGMVQSTGEIMVKKKDRFASVEIVSFVPNHTITSAVSYPYLFPVLVAVLLAGLICFIHIFSRGNTSPDQ